MAGVWTLEYAVSFTTSRIESNNKEKSGKQQRKGQNKN